ncbi:hypothetical protein B0I27_102220 [Arcticibacter pallidicorallinus]|uniref:Uncharacterized protein n=1 Tax=Arcticibacter pallidicorallinus TaxID=1259464 RepID=A0A2T0U960_9SPHI|nr:hypothetical protein B0I27_102220 [Arcticibacter pallidicorallinus]
MAIDHIMKGRLLATDKNRIYMQPIIYRHTGVMSPT